MDEIGIAPTNAGKWRRKQPNPAYTRKIRHAARDWRAFHAVKPLSIGIVGAGRTRSGLGPFLAEFAERAGLRVTAIAGRSWERATQNAGDLGVRLRHVVTPYRDLDGLCDSGIDALLIASPTVAHLAALEAALAARLPVLCDKPLVHEDHGEAGAALVQAFAAAGVLCVENCQWPFVLPALPLLRCDATSAYPAQVALGLAPARAGREMVQGMLPHLLSVVQALVPVDERVGAYRVSLDPPDLDGRPTTLRFALVGPRFAIDAALHLHLCIAPPRPAWIEIDGERMDRYVASDFSFSFDGAAGRVEIPDPTAQLVRRFAELVRDPQPLCIRNEVAQVGQRLRLYREILRMLP